MSGEISRGFSSTSFSFSCCFFFSGSDSSFFELAVTFSSALPGLLWSFSNVSRMLCFFDFHTLSGDDCFPAVAWIAATASNRALLLPSLDGDATNQIHVEQTTWKGYRILPFSIGGWGTFPLGFIVHGERSCNLAWIRQLYTIADRTCRSFSTGYKELGYQ